MRSPLLAWLAVLPLLVACGADADPAPEGEVVPEVVSHKDGPAADPAAPVANPAAGATTPASTCGALPACNGAAGPQLGAKRPLNHSVVSNLVMAAGPAFHRGRDQIVAVGDAQWVIGKITYSFVDKDLKDEDVDIYVERGCAGAWEKLGTARTTSDGTHATVEGVEDTGGRVYFEIPKAKALGAGRHRIRLVVAADQTSTDLLMDVVPKAAPIVVSDVDGTLTESERAEYPALLTGSLPNAQPEAPAALSALASKGYRVVYLTARPEWLTGRTKEFLAARGFPAGIVHTTTGLTGALGDSASTFKSAELAQLQAHGLAITWAFGNTESDADAYQAAKVQPLDHRVLLQLTDAHGGRRIESYSAILPVLTALPSTCP